LHRHQTDSLTTSTATHAIQQITGVPGATQKDDIYYCIKWDLRSATNKTVELTARAKGKRTNTVRTWTPENEELNKYWDVPLRAVFTYWSNKHIVEWSGEGPIQASSGLSSSNASHGMPAGYVLPCVPLHALPSVTSASSRMGVHAPHLDLHAHCKRTL
jgi:hypothetical protein